VDLMFRLRGLAWLSSSERFVNAFREVASIESRIIFCSVLFGRIVLRHCVKSGGDRVIHSLLEIMRSTCLERTI
jgi:hypothetical protein